MAGRHANGSGTVYRRKDGRFEGAAYLPTASGATRRIRVYARTHKEAHNRLLAKLDQARRGIPQPDVSWTVGAYLDYWMANVVSAKNRPRTIELYESTIRLHIKPYLATKRLASLSVTDAQTAMNALLSDGHSARTVHKARTVLSSALGRAWREELVHRNVARLVELPGYERKDITPWTADQATAFLSAATGHQWEPGFLLLLHYGLRRGEVIGLRWGDIDFRDNLFHIRQQIQRIDGQLLAGSVKTNAGRRTLPLLPTLRDLLIVHAATHGIHLAPGADPDHTDHADRLVITSQTGRPVDPKNFVRAFHLIRRKAGLPRITVHHTRHTTATLLKSLGVPARDAQLILGHAHVSTTQQIYQHGDIQAQRQALESVERALIDRDRAEPHPAAIGAIVKTCGSACHAA